jgi:hypothetical protein
MTFSLENGSVTPDRFTTERLAVSIVVNRFIHLGHCLRRRIADPSSDVRESTTRESGCLQNGQCTSCSYRLGLTSGSFYVTRLVYPSVPWHSIHHALITRNSPAPMTPPMCGFIRRYAQHKGTQQRITHTVLMGLAPKCRMGHSLGCAPFQSAQPSTCVATRRTT